MKLIGDFCDRVGARDVYDACELAVKRFFGEIKDGDGRDVVATAREKKIALRKAEMREDGCLTWDSEDKPCITISRWISPNRQRFTVAHELGHWAICEVLGNDGRAAGSLFRGRVQGGAHYREEERLADMIAAEVLMPRSAVRQILNNATRINHAVVKFVAHHFKVSEIAGLRRIAEVDGRDVVMIKVIPSKIRDRNSPAYVDDFMLIHRRNGIKYDRKAARVVGDVPFSRIHCSRDWSGDVEINGVRKQFDFSVTAKQSPIPHADLLSFFSA